MAGGITDESGDDVSDAAYLVAALDKGVVDLAACVALVCLQLKGLRTLLADSDPEGLGGQGLRKLFRELNQTADLVKDLCTMKKHGPDGA